MKLSTHDLGLFFGERHQRLARDLIEAAEELGAIDEPGAAAQAMARLGLYAYLLPKQGPVDVRSLVLIREMLAQVSPLADSIFAVHGLGSYPILLAGTEHDRAHRLAEYRSGLRLGAFALTEPGAGSDVASMQTVAVADAHGWLLRGEKTLISNVGIATHYVVFANADPSAGRRGISAFLVEAGAPGLTEFNLEPGFSHPLGGLRFEDCRVAKEALLGEVGAGMGLAMRTLDTFRVTVGAAAVGMARRALDEALAHVRAREQFGKPLAAHQLVQAKLADMATELDAARLLVLRAAWARDSGRERVTVEAAMSKLYATEAAQRIIDEAVQLFGGRGVLLGNPVEALYRAIRPLRIYEGTSEIQRLIIGGALAKGEA